MTGRRPRGALAAARARSSSCRARFSAFGCGYMPPRRQSAPRRRAVQAGAVHHRGAEDAAGVSSAGRCALHAVWYSTRRHDRGKWLARVGAEGTPTDADPPRLRRPQTIPGDPFSHHSSPRSARAFTVRHCSPMSQSRGAHREHPQIHCFHRNGQLALCWL